MVEHRLDVTRVVGSNPTTRTMEKIYKIVIFSPESHADKLREAIAKAGAGVIGNYTHYTFSLKGIGRFKPVQGANPAI